MTTPARAVRGEARRALILDAALEVVAEEGAGALTHRRVAAAAGLPLAATTYWFASKDELLTEAYRLAADRDTARMRALAERLQDVGAADLAAALADLLLADLAGGRSALIAAYSLWLEAARHPGLREVERAWTATYVELVTGLLERAGSRSAAVDAPLLVAALDGLLLAQLSQPDADPDATVRVPLERLVTALLRR